MVNVSLAALVTRRSFSAVGRGVPVLAMLGAMACGVERQDTPVAPAEPRMASSIVQDTVAPVYNLENPRRVPGRYMVGFKNGVTDVHAAAADIASRHRGKVRSIFDIIHGFSAELPDGAIEALRRNPNVEYIEAVVTVSPASVGDTVQVAPRLPLDRIDQRALPLDGTYVYQTQLTGAGVRIWIVDSGVEPTEPDLQGRVDLTLSMTTYAGTSPFAPCSTHGTGVALAAAGTIAGIAKAATINVARIRDAQCNGTQEDIVTAITWIMGNSSQPAAINVSYGAVGSSPSTDNSVRYAANHGVPVMVSAGNDNINACNVTPAKTGEAITVGASMPDLDQKQSYSNWGNCVDIFAPIEYFGGTSFATGLVSGYAAILLQQNPSRTPNALMQIMADNSTKGILTGIGATSPNRLLYVR
jgi:subtilisin family serine protease